MTDRCGHVWLTGVECTRKPQTASTFCWQHDPATKETRKKTGRRSRRKGSTFERQVANELKSIFPRARRAGLRQTQSGADDAPDVDGCAPLWIETKHGKQPNPRAALIQAEEALAAWIAKGGDPATYLYPLAVCKDDRKPPFVVMRWEHFKELVMEWQNGPDNKQS